VHDLVGGVGSGATIVGRGVSRSPRTLVTQGAGFQPSPCLGLELKLRIRPRLPLVRSLNDKDRFVEGYVVVDWIKLESLRDHSTRSTSTKDYSMGFSKKNHAQFSHHINIKSLSYMIDYIVYLYLEHPSKLSVNISIDKKQMECYLSGVFEEFSFNLVQPPTACAVSTKIAITPRSEVQKMHRLLSLKLDSYIFLVI
jgi:hypothetical protein